jgi:hypothetical protein
MNLGELFVGQSFGALDSHHPPKYMEDIDRHFISRAINGNFPWIYKILELLPAEGIKKLTTASSNLQEV